MLDEQIFYMQVVSRGCMWKRERIEVWIRAVDVKIIEQDTNAFIARYIN